MYGRVNVVMKKQNKKDIQLGMSFSTATHRLRKMVLFDLLKSSGKDKCFHCLTPIDKIEELSMEHKQPWMNKSVDLFWDVKNIAFSHLKCNVDAAKPNSSNPAKHGNPSKYRTGCRCVECKKGHAKAQREWKYKKNSKVL